MTRGAARADRPARLRDAGRHARSCRRHLRRAPRAAPGADGRPRGYDRLVVYADREHSAEPRLPDRLRPALRGGGPGRRAGRRPGDPRRQRVLRDGRRGAAADAPASCFQDLSLPSQPRDRSRPLARDPGRRGHRPGQPGRRRRLEDVRRPGDDRRARVPRRRAARGWPAPAGSVENATDLLIDAARRPARRSTRSSSSRPSSTPPARRRPACRRLLFGLRPGHDRARGRPRCSAGTARRCRATSCSRPAPRATLGLLSPGDRPIERGDRFTIAFGIWGALNCRAGFVVEDAAELPAGHRATTSSAWSAPYFEAVAEWYGALRVGQTGGTLQEIVDRHLGDPFFGIFLNPGHQIHLDEWVNSPIAPGSTIELRSGMAFQVDIIPATGTDYFTTNIEDGIALADETLRAAFAAALPGRLGADRGAPPVHGATRSGSTSTRTCCRSRTSRPACRRSCSGRSGR